MIIENREENVFKKISPNHWELKYTVKYTYTVKLIYYRSDKKAQKIHKGKKKRKYEMENERVW